MVPADVPTLQQIQNLVKRLKPPARPLTDNDLCLYAEAHLNVPDNENKPFVVDFLPFDDADHFVLVWSTSKLIQIQNASQILATDATYKLSW